MAQVLTSYLNRPKIYTPDDAAFYAQYGDWPTSESLIPLMISNSAPSGLVSASSSYSATPPWYAFSGLLASYNGWITNRGGAPAWLQYQFANQITINGYWVIPWSADTYPARCITAWKLQGSNDGFTWTDLDTQSIADYTTLSITDRNIFTLSEPANYQYYRLYITENFDGNGYGGLKRMGLL